MEYTAYARTVLRRWPLVLGLMLLAGLTAYTYGARAPRVYRATAQLSVTPSVVEFFTGEAIQRLLSNYSLQLRSRIFAAEVAPRLQPPATVDQVAGKVRAVAAPAEYRIAIEVDDGDPVRAQQIANAAAAAFVDRIRAENAGREKRDIAIDVLEWAEVPATPVSPRPRRDAFGAAILGAVIGIALAFVLEWWDDTFTTADEAAAALGMPLLGAIPGAPTNRTIATGVLNGFRRRRPAGRGRLHESTLAARGGVPDAAHEHTLRVG